MALILVQPSLICFCWHSLKSVSVVLLLNLVFLDLRFIHRGMLFDGVEIDLVLTSILKLKMIMTRTRIQLLYNLLSNFISFLLLYSWFAWWTGILRFLLICMRHCLVFEIRIHKYLWWKEIVYSTFHFSSSLGSDYHYICVFYFCYTVHYWRIEEIMYCRSFLYTISCIDRYDNENSRCFATTKCKYPSVTTVISETMNSSIFYDISDLFCLDGSLSILLMYRINQMGILSDSKESNSRCGSSHCILSISYLERMPIERRKFNHWSICGYSE